MNKLNSNQDKKYDKKVLSFRHPKCFIFLPQKSLKVEIPVLAPMVSIVKFIRDKRMKNRDLI